MHYLTLIITLLCALTLSAQPMSGVPRLLLPRGVVWVEQGLYGSLGLGQVRQWNNGEFLHINEAGGFAYSPRVIGSMTVRMIGGIYTQKKYIYVAENSPPDLIRERRIFFSEKYGMDAKISFVSDNKKSLFYISPLLELNNASSSSLETATELNEKIEEDPGNANFGKLVDLENNPIEREFVGSKGWLVGFELGYAERYRSFIGVSGSANGKVNLFDVDYSNLVSYNQKGAGIPVWELSGTIGASIDLIEIWPGITEHMNALFLYSDVIVTWDYLILNFVSSFGVSMAI